MTDNIDEGIFYDDDTGTKGRVSLREPPKLADAPATDYWKKHNEGRFLLNHFHQHGTTQEKFQAAKELKINDRKMNFWSKHKNFDHEEAMAHTQKLKKQWGGFKESFDPSMLDEGSADAFMKFRAKAAAASKSDEDKVRDFLAKGGTIKKAPAKPMSNKLSMSRNVVKTQDFDKELRQAAAYLKNKSTSTVKEGMDMTCSGCGEHLGKASEQRKTVRCGNCGRENGNPHYDYPAPASKGSYYNRNVSSGGTGRYNGALSNRVSWPHNYKESVDMDEENLDEVSNPNLARLLAMRQKAGNSVGDVKKEIAKKVVSQTSGENSKDVQDFLEKGGRITKVAKGKRNYRWPDGNPERIARKGIKEEENLDETKLVAGTKANVTNPKIPQERSKHTILSVGNNHVKMQMKDRPKPVKFPKSRILKANPGRTFEEAEYGKPLGAKPLSQIIAKPARKVHEYDGNTPDEKAIVKRYRDNTVLIPDANGNGDDIFKAAKIKRAVKPVDPGQDEKNYAEWNGDVPVVESIDYSFPSHEIPKEHRDGDKHIVGVHRYDRDHQLVRAYLGNGEKNGKPSLESIHTGEKKAKVFDTYGAAHDHVTNLLKGDENRPSWSDKKVGNQYSIHPKRTDDAIAGDEAARAHFSNKESGHLEAYKATGDVSHLDQARSAARARLNANHPLARTNGHSQGMYTHRGNELKLMGPDMYPDHYADLK